MTSDIDILANSKGSFDTIKDHRIRSVVARSIGIGLIATGAIIVLFGLVTLPTAPIFSLLCVVGAVVCFIFAHDAIIMGNNWHKLAALGSFKSGGIVDLLFEGIGKFSACSDVIAQAHRALAKGSHFELEGTWLIGPIFSRLDSR